MTPVKDKTPRHFKLPKVKEGTIDEAIHQLDLATSYFGLHQSIETATEVSIAARRYVNAMEEAEKQERLNLETMERFFEDIKSVREQFKRMRAQYQVRINDGKRRKHETYHHLQRDYDIMGYYLILLSRQTQRIRELTIPANDNYDTL